MASAPSVQACQLHRHPLALGGVLPPSRSQMDSPITLPSRPTAQVTPPATQGIDIKSKEPPTPDRPIMPAAPHPPNTPDLSAGPWTNSLCYSSSTSGEPPTSHSPKPVNTPLSSQAEVITCSLVLTDLLVFESCKSHCPNSPTSQDPTPARVQVHTTPSLPGQLLQPSLQPA